MGISGQFSGTTSARGTQCRSFLGVERLLKTAASPTPDGVTFLISSLQ